MPEYLLVKKIRNEEEAQKKRAKKGQKRKEKRNERKKEAESRMESEVDPTEAKAEEEWMEMSESDSEEA